MLSVTHRLGAVLAEVDDGQSSVSQPDTSAYLQTTAIRAAVCDKIRVPSNHIGIGRPNLIHKAEYSAHARLSRLTFAPKFTQ
jgi:hypothetical protein